MKPETDTRQKLLAAATELMWQSGYGSVSVDDICFRAGVRKGSFYYFFPSKCDLTVAAIGCLWETSKARYDQIFSSQTPPMERFHNYFQFLIEAQQQKLTAYGKVCGCPYCTLGSEMSTQEERIRVKIEAVFSSFLPYLEMTLTELIQEEAIAPCSVKIKAREVMALIMGVLLQAKVTNSLAPIRLLPEATGLLIGVPLTMSTESPSLA